MGFRNWLKRISLFKKMYINLLIGYYRFLTLLSPKLNTKIRYKQVFGKKMDLRNPKTLNDKILKLKLEKYGKDPLVKKCADKFAVREYVSSCDYGDILVPLIAIYDKVSEIEWDRLPESFAMKWNFGCGYNIICPKKSELDIVSSIKKMKKWKNSKKYLDYSEVQYMGVKKKILVEEYLSSIDNVFPADYKVYCFNGIPRAILYMDDRGKECIRAAFFDIDWNYIGKPQNSKYLDFDFLPSKPECLTKMIEASKRLSLPFEFVRVDFYCVGGKLYFGEMTFTPAGGFFVSQCLIDGLPMGHYLKM